VRETFARHVLVDLLMWAFESDEILAIPDDDLEHGVVYLMRDRVGAVEPAWVPAMETLRGVPVASLRRELAQAFPRIRAIAQAVAAGQPTAMTSVTVRLYIPSPASDREGKPRWSLDGHLADGLIWMTVKLLSQVPRSLIRRCAFAGCARIYVASKHQRYCAAHQAEARRQMQRRAERAFRARAKKQKPTTRRKR
jgi:hypothetical protein